MNIEFEKLQGICPHRWNRHTNDGSFKICEVQDKICSEANCPLKSTDISVIMANDAVRNMHVVTDNSEKLNNALARIAMLEKKIKSYYCNCDIKEIRIDQVPTCECCNRPIFMEEG